MKFKIDIDNAWRQVDAAADGTVVIDGETFKTKVAGTGVQKRTVQIGEKTYDVRVTKRIEGEGGQTGGFLLEIGGERVSVVVKDITKGTPQASGTEAAAALHVAGPQAPGAPEAGGKVAADYKDGIWAPVPGKVVDIRVKVGDKVTEGDLILILEAMKMENELHAPKQATVAAVLVSKGDQASKGQLLVAFE